MDFIEFEREEDPLIKPDQIVNLGDQPQTLHLLKCSICGGLLSDPVECPDCEKPFCAAHHASYLSRKGSCYNGCATRATKQLHRGIRSLLSLVQLHCPFQELGCASTLSYDAYDQHVHSCTVQCLHCGDMVKSKGMQHHHEHECLEFIVPCKCCNKEMKRKELHQHYQISSLKKRIAQLELQLRQHSQGSSSPSQSKEGTHEPEMLLVASPSLESLVSSNYSFCTAQKNPFLKKKPRQVLNKVYRTLGPLGIPLEGYVSDADTSVLAEFTELIPDSYFRGQVHDKTKEPHGYGIEVNVETGKVYEGGFFFGRKQGRGRIVVTGENGKGNYYEGEFCNDVYHGRGCYSWANGDRYEGMLVEGRKEGQGVMLYRDGDVYRGAFKDNMREGLGVHVGAQSGDTHVGEYREDLGCGLGIFFFANGERYLGEWRDGEFNGEGTFYYEDGSKYHGRWENDKRNGPGTLTTKEGRVTKGVWMQDQLVTTVEERKY